MLVSSFEDLLDQKFTVYTDNMTAKYLFTKRELDTRLQRWCLSVQEYDFEIKHVDGNKKPFDSCSRYPLVESQDSHDGEEILDQLFPALAVVDMINEVDYEEELKQLCHCLARCLEPFTPQEVIRKLEVKSARYMMGDHHHLYRLVGKASGQRYVKIPFQLERSGILVEVHDDGHSHSGINGTWSVLYQNYWWPGVYGDIKLYLQSSCHECQLYSPAPNERSPHRGTSQNIMGIFMQFSIDYLSPLPITDTGCKYILVCTEMVTRWPTTVATKHADAITAATFLYEEVSTKFGPMTTLLSDNGSHFANQVVEKYDNLCQPKHKFGIPYHPETQGMVEKLNHTLVNALRKLAHQRPNTWDTHPHTLLYS